MKQERIGRRYPHAAVVMAVLVLCATVLFRPVLANATPNPLDGWMSISGSGLRDSYVSNSVLTSGKYYLTADAYDPDGNTGAIYIDGDVTIDLNGYVYYYKGTTSLFHVRSGGSLTITDSSGASETTTTVSGNLYGNDATLSFNSDGTTPNSLTYYVTESTVSGTGTSETLAQHTVSFGGGTGVGAISAENSSGANSVVYVDGGTFNLSGGLLTMPYGSSHSSGVHLVEVNTGTFNMSGGYLAGANTGSNSGDTSWGAGVRLSSSGATMNLTGGVIAANTATAGAGIYAANGTTLNVSGGTISGNYTKGNTYSWVDAATDGYGAGIYGVGSSVNVSGGYITNNSVKDYYSQDGQGLIGGGGIAVVNDSSQGSLSVSGGYITGNYSQEAGGGIYAGRTNKGLGTNFTISGGTIASNKAQDSEAGGVRVSAGTTATISAASGSTIYITNNSTGTTYDWGGGGIFVQEGGYLKVINSLITSNTAAGYGGGVGACPTGETIVSSTNGTAIYSNTANGTQMSGGGHNKSYDTDVAQVSSTFTSSGYQDYFIVRNSSATGTIAVVTGTMLGGEAAGWSGSVDGTAVTIDKGTAVGIVYVAGLTASPTADAQTAAKNAASVIISGNSSGTHGGGIMSNGQLSLGSAETVESWPPLTIEASKALSRLVSAGGTDTTNATLAKDQFSFVLLMPDTATGTPTWDTDGSLVTTGFTTVQTVTNAADGSITFDAVNLESATTHTFYVAENCDTTDTTVVTWDKTIYKVEATVAQKSQTSVMGVTYTSYEITALTVTPYAMQSGTLTAGSSQTISYTAATDGSVTLSLAPTAGSTDESFSNVLSPSSATGSVTLSATKTLNGGTLSDGQFSFQLLDENNNVMQTKTNDASGNVAFDAINYTEADFTGSELSATKTYTIKEVAGSASNVTYDSSVYTVTVTLSRDSVEATSITATPSYTLNGSAVNAVTFTNTQWPTIKISGSKELDGSTLTDNEFTFMLLTPTTATDMPSWNSDGSLNTTGFSVAYAYNGAPDATTGLGAFTFANQALKSASTHTFYVAEQYDSTNTDVTDWDQSIYKVEAVVSGTGTLSSYTVTRYYMDGDTLTADDDNAITDNSPSTTDGVYTITLVQDSIAAAGDPNPSFVNYYETTLPLSGGAGLGILLVVGAGLFVWGMLRARRQVHGGSGTGFMAAFAAIGVAAALSLGLAAPAQAETNSYDAYQLFNCTVVDAETQTVTHLTWASDGVRDTVNNAIQTYDSSYTGTTAQEAAEWLTAQSSGGIEAGSALRAVAVALYESGASTQAMVNGGTVSTPTGYYLLLSDPDSLEDGEASTAPIYVLLVQGQTLDVTSKSTAPGVQKHVLEDSTSTWEKVADATIGDELWWRLEATVPAGLTGYDSYYLTFHDTPSAGLDTSQVADTLTVWWHAGVVASADMDAVGTGDATSAAAAGWHQIEDATLELASDGSFTVSTGDLQGLMTEAGENLAGGATVVAVYSAPLSTSCNVGVSAGNPNDVCLEYSSNPLNSHDTSKTERHRSVVYTWEIALTKRDATSEAGLAGATLRITDDRGRTLAEDGTWDTAAEATVTTPEGGVLVITGVDSGIFAVEELAAPSGYVLATGSHTLTLTAEFSGISNDDEALLTSLDVTLTLTAEEPLRSDSVDDETGQAAASLLNTPEEETPHESLISRLLPKTGDPTTWGPTLLVLAVAGMLVGAGVKHRRQEGNDSRA